MNHINRFIGPLKYTLNKDEAFVCVNEEFGFRNWFWFPQVSQKELVSIWKKTHVIDKFNFRSVLPGKFVLAGNASGYYNENLMNLWFFLIEKNISWGAFVFDNSNSTLFCNYPFRRIYHKDRYRANLELERDIKQQMENL